MINLDAAFNFTIKPELKTAEGCEIDWPVPTNLQYFEGHFPGNPLIPAFGIVDANLFIMEKLLNAPVRIKKLTTARFSAPIMPGMKINIKIEKASENTWKCEWRDLDPAQSLKVLSEMTLVLNPTV